jgi:hypothetical protein
MNYKNTFVYQILLVIIACLIFGSCSEQKSEFFVNGVEAQRSQTAKSGWIPQWFPATAKEIHVQYDLDTNYCWFRFKLDKGSKDTFIRAFQPVSWNEVENLKVRAPRSAGWWFEGLIQAQPANDAALNADVFVRNDIKISEKAYLAISRTDDSIFLWIER